MANMFDDLAARIPAPGAAPSAAQPAGGGRANMFDELAARIPAPGSADTSGRLPAGHPEGRVQTSEPVGDGSFLDTAKDAALSLGAGVKVGAAGLIGLPDTLRKGANIAFDHTVGRAVNAARSGLSDWSPPSQEQRAAADNTGPDIFPSTERVVGWTENVTGPTHQPKTGLGDYAKTTGEFAAGALFGGGTIPQRIAQVVVPAIASETAGKLTKGSAAEPYARLGGAIAGGLGTAVVQARRGAPAMVGEAIEGLPPQEMAAARALMDEAAALPGGGVRLTLDEALNQVTGGRAPRLSQLARVAANSGGEGGRRMADVAAARPGQIEATGRQAIDTLGPVNASPSSIGPAVGREAGEIVEQAQGIINRGTRPFYQASDQTRVGPQIGGGLASDPLYQQTLAEVRGNPALNRGIAHLPDDAGGVIDLVQRRMREQADNARTVGQPSTSNLAAANYEDARRAPIAALETATGSRPATSTGPAVVGDYEAARAAQAAARERFLQPLMDGPIGQLAQKDMTTQRAISTLFPANPLPNSAGEVGSAIHALSNRGALGERVARDLVRAHIESEFNAATAGLQGGPNVMGGARFARELTGNPQAAANVEAAIRALPQGETIADGFNRFLEVMRATGYKPAKGSDTAFNQSIQKGMESAPGVIGAAAEQLSQAGLGLKRFVSDKWAAYRVGQNTDELAFLLTDPAAVPLLRQLSRETVGTGRAEYLVARLAQMGERAVNGRRRPPE